MALPQNQKIRHFLLFMNNSLLGRVMRLNNLYLISLLFLITVICYANTLGNGLFFDDEQFIYNNQAVKSFDIGSLIGKSLTSGSGRLSNYYRPVLFFGFSLEYQIFGSTGAIYHFDSIIIHFAGGIALFFFLTKLFKNKPLAFLTTLFFLIHPIQTEAVSYASGRGDPLSFFFIMLSLYWSMSNKRNMISLSLISFVLALLSKEIALMTPGLIFIISLFSKGSITKKNVQKSIIHTLPYAFLAGGYFLLRLTILDFANTLNFYNSTNMYSGSLAVRLYNFFNLLPSYFGLLLFPKTLFMERDSGIKIVTEPTLASLLSLAAIIVGFIIGILKRKEFPLILFSLLWIGITFVPTSGILPINGIFYEHFLYFPSVGFFLLFSFGILRLYSKSGHKLRYCLDLLLICIVLLLCTRTILRNNDWHDPIAFYKQTLSHVQSPRAYNNLAMAYAESGDNKHAIASYKKAIQLVDAYPESHYNLGNSYLALNQITNAELEYKKALEVDPAFYLAYVKLFTMYKSTQNQKGITFVETGLKQLGKYNPQFLELLKQLEKNP